MLKPLLLLSTVVLFVTATTPSPTRAAGQPPQANHPGASHEKVKKLYAVDCAICHGDNGDGKTDMAKDMSLTLVDWTDPKSLATLKDQELFDVIRKGKGDKMPPEEASRAKDDDIWNLVIYIRSFSKGHPAAAAAAPGTR